MDEILVSVIMPAHNCSSFIKETIESVLTQDIQNIEILVVDDCSQDETANIVESINDNRIKLIKNDANFGAAYSRNLAISLSKGKYIAFLDGDDIWMPNKLKSQIEFMEKNNYWFTYTNYSILGNNKYYFSGPKKITHRRFFRRNYVGCLTVVFKRDIMPNLSIPTTIKSRNDYALWLKLSEKTNCYLFNEVLAKYRKHSGNSLSTAGARKLFVSHIKMFQELYGYNKFHAFLCASRNVFHILLKNLLYRRKA